MLMQYQAETVPAARRPDEFARGRCSFGTVLLDAPLDLTLVNEIQFRAWVIQAARRGDVPTVEQVERELMRRAG